MKKTTMGAMALLSGFMLLGCANGNTAKVHVKLVYDETDPECAFAVSELKAEGEKNHLSLGEEGDDYSIVFAPLDATLGQEGYQLSVTGKTITITGGDATGRMYGGLQLAEEIGLHQGLDGIEGSVGKPAVAMRGLRLTPTLDLRTPGYADLSRSNQVNIENSWSLDFWKEEFDQMARMRFNAILFTTIDPWPNFVVVPGYENCAIADVWKTKLDFTDAFNGTASNYLNNSMLQPGTYEVIKKMTIQEKIAHWQTVMQAANERGIQFDFSSQNVYMYGETYDSTKPAFWKDPSPFADVSQDYGISNDLDNEVTKDYVRKAVKQMCLTYPRLHEISPTAGENMEYQGTDVGFNDKWLASTYGEGIKDALKEKPDCGICLSLGLHRTTFANLDAAWKGFPLNYSIGDKYSQEHMYGTSKPTFVSETEKAIRDEWETNGKLHPMTVAIRNEDAFHYVWGDPSWVRDYLGNMPKGDVLRGFYLCTTGYSMMKDYSHVDESLNGKLYLQRHWLNFTLFGRLGYDLSLSVERIHSLIQLHFRTISSDQVGHFVAAVESASAILTAMGRQYTETGTDRSWYPEMCWSHPLMYGFISAKRFMSLDNAQSDGGTYSIPDYCKLVEEGAASFDEVTPLETAKTLEDSAAKALSEVEAIRASLKGESAEQKEFREAVLDQASFAYLGEYYADKVLGSVDLRLYNDGQCADETKKASAVAHFEKGIADWGNYSDNFKDRYIVERYTRLGVIDPVAMKDAVAEDLSKAQKWSYRPL